MIILCIILFYFILSDQEQIADQFFCHEKVYPQDKTRQDKTNQQNEKQG